jgi:hypothetical protein
VIDEVRGRAGTGQWGKRRAVTEAAAAFAEAEAEAARGRRIRAVAEAEAVVAAAANEAAAEAAAATTAPGDKTLQSLVAWQRRGSRRRVVTQ